MSCRAMARFDHICRAVGSRGDGVTLAQLADAARLAEELDGPKADRSLVEDLTARLGLSGEDLEASR